MIKFLYGVSACALSAVFIVNFANAQESREASQAATSAEEQGVNDIIVTAQKRSENMNRVGVSISAVTGDTLAQKGITDTADLVKIAPGFNFVQSAYGVPVLTLRGIGFYDTAVGAAPAVSVYIDEVPLPLSIMSLGATLDLERVEVLKGPQGTLYGQNATGGAINYIAAKPSADFETGLDVTYGRFNRVEVKGFAAAPITSTLSARISARFDRNDDWQRSYTRDATNGEGNILTGRAILHWEPTSTVRVNFMAHGWRDRSENQAQQLVGVTSPRAPAALAAYPLPPRNNRAADFDPDFSLKRDSWFWQTSIRAEIDLSDELTFTSITSYAKLKRFAPVDADGTALQAYGIISPGNSEDFYQEARIGSVAKIGGSHR